MALHTEVGRLASFTSNARSWPLPAKHSVTIEKLAQAGFYFAPSADEPDGVTCFLCNKGMGGWEAGDDPLSEHCRSTVSNPHKANGKAKYPHGCPYAVLKSGPAKVKELGLDDKKLTQMRKETFGQKKDNWWPYGARPSVAKLVQAGFWFDAEEEDSDQVVCLYCDVQIGNWQKSDDPMYASVVSYML